MTQPDVLVVGAGPVGLVTALGLARAGVRVTVVEKEPAIVDSPRAMVYHRGLFGGLERLGILDDVIEAGVKTTTFGMLVRRTGEWLRPSAGGVEDGSASPFNIHLGQDGLAEIALAHLRRLPGAEVLFDTRVTGVDQDADGVTVHAVSGTTDLRLRAGWAVGTDGGRSAVRDSAGIGFEGMTWPERFVATNVRYDFGRSGFAAANFVLDPEHGAIVAVIDRDGLWRCTYSEDASLPEETVHERIPAYFAQALPGRQDYELVQYSPYRMHQRAATTFRAGRVLLAGDAAHLTNPVGGLGLTSGLFDSYVLSEALAAVVQERIGDEVLDRYARDRRDTFLKVASPSASALKELVFHTAGAESLERAVADLRRTASDPGLHQRRPLVTAGMLETPSLVAGV